ncbi:MAG TPA: adenylate/guanylate cyclase domain-containing protein [Blastocatellia bacterium]|jgi:class 3 adenylate cyclase|nr:adenylate/guanylate cyclase domain-containing protein [Blastocatellia bacterium]
MNDTSSDNEKSLEQVNSRQALGQLLNDMISFPERRAEIARNIEDTFGQSKAVLTLDMSGFSRTTQQHGIISFLLMIHQMQLICSPCIEQCGGKVIKTDADNLFCLFDTVADAVKASQEIITRLNAVNVVLPAERQLYVAFGIGYGKILNIGDEDIFGDEMNLACKLGEDIAEKGEILLTPAANAELNGSGVAMREGSISISGMHLNYYYVER